MDKKEWEKPKLVVLYRGRPEEDVLMICKVVNSAGPGAGSNCNEGGAWQGNWCEREGSS